MKAKDPLCIGYFFLEQQRHVSAVKWISWPVFSTGLLLDHKKKSTEDYFQLIFLKSSLKNLGKTSISKSWTADSNHQQLFYVNRVPGWFQCLKELLNLPLNLVQWLSKCGPQIPAGPWDPFRGPQDGNYFHNDNTKVVFVLLMVLTFVLMVQNWR